MKTFEFKGLARGMAPHFSIFSSVPDGTNAARVRSVRHAAKRLRAVAARYGLSPADEKRIAMSERYTLLCGMV